MPTGSLGILSLLSLKATACARAGPQDLRDLVLCWLLPPSLCHAVILPGCLSDGFPCRCQPCAPFLHPTVRSHCALCRILSPYLALPGMEEVKCPSAPWERGCLSGCARLVWLGLASSHHYSGSCQLLKAPYWPCVRSQKDII